MNINDWLALEERYKFKFPPDFFPLYEELEKSRVISDWESDGLDAYLRLCTPEMIEQRRRNSVDPDLIPIIITPTGGDISLRIPFKSSEPAIWIETDIETNYRASLGRSFAGVIRVLAAYMDAWSFDCSADGKLEDTSALLRRSRKALAEVRGLMDERERERLIRLRFWPLGIAESPVDGNPKLTVPSFRCIRDMLSLGESLLGWARMEFNDALEEDPSFGAGHWFMGVAYSRDDNVVGACREFSLLMEGDLRTAHPVIDRLYAGAYGDPPVANFRLAAQYLRAHAEGYRLVSKNSAVPPILLGDDFDKMGGWLDGLGKAMKNGLYEDALPIAQSLLASYLGDEWFADSGDVDQFGTCTDAIRTIYSAVGLECRVKEMEK